MTDIRQPISDVAGFLLSQMDPLLPINSHIKSFEEVESDPYFINIRQSLLSLVVTHGFKEVAHVFLEKLELQNFDKSSYNDFELVLTIVILTRLLADLCEIFWRKSEKSPETTVKNGNGVFSSFYCGFSLQSATLHARRPQEFDRELADTAFRVFFKLKSNRRVVRLLKRMFLSIHGNSSVALAPPMLTEDDLDSNKRSKYHDQLLDIIDEHCAYLFKYFAASNPLEFHAFLRSKVISPLLITHSQTEGEVSPYLCLFSYHFITSENLSTFLDILQKLISRMRKTIYQEILLFFASEAIQSWISARPADYLKLMDLAGGEPPSQTYSSVQRISTFLFEEIYSNFNINSILTEGATTSTPPTPCSTNDSIPSSWYADSSEEYAIYEDDIDLEGDTSRLSSSYRYYTSNIEVYDEMEDLTRTSILTFITLMVILSPDAFEEVNSTTLRNIPDELQTNEDDGETPDDKCSSDYPFITKKSNISTIGYKIGLKRLRNQIMSLNNVTNKKVKFLLTILKNINGSNIISEQATFDTLWVLVLISSLSSYVASKVKESSITYFSRRLFFIMCDLLQIASEKESKKNPMISLYLARYPTSHLKLQVNYFYVACSLEPNAFLEKLGDYIKKKHTGLAYLKMITDGFFIFFNTVPLTESKTHILMKVDNFLKDKAYEMSSILLTSSPLFGKNVSDVVDDLIDKKLPQEVEHEKILFNPSPIPSASPAFMNLFAKGQDAALKSNSRSSSSSSLSQNDLITSQNIATKHLRDIVAPTARRPSKASMASSRDSTSPTENDKPLTTILSKLDKNVKSPLRTSSSMRKSSQESINAITVKGIREGLQRDDGENIQIARMILMNIFSIYKGMSHRFIMSYNEEENKLCYSNEYRRMVKPLFASLVDGNRGLSDTAHGILTTITSRIPDVFEETDTFQPICYVTVGYLITLTCTTLFDLNISDARRKQILKPIVNLWTARLEISKYYESLGNLESLFKEEESTFSMVRGSAGRALFCSMCSNDATIHTLLKAAFKLFIEEIRIHRLLHTEDEDGDMLNMEFYQVMCRDSFVSTGVVAFQRRVRSDILKYLKRPDKIIYDVSHLTYKKWYQLAQRNGLSQAELSHFRNYAGFLASCCGVFSTINESSLKELPFLNDMKDSLESKVTYFIERQCNWLNNEELLTRENSKDILATELHPLTFKTLFRVLQQRVNDLKNINLSAKENEYDFVLLEQILVVIRIILERDDTSTVLILVSVELLDLIDDIFKLVDTVPKTTSKYFKCVIHLSKMLKSFKHSESHICISGYMVVKNRWLMLVIQWFESAIFQEFDLQNLSKSHFDMDLEKRDMDYLYIDTTIESSKAISYLTKDLVLEAPQSMSEIELQRSKSVVFGNYFNILLKALEKSACVENFPPTLRHKISLLNENIIVSLTNLLIANVDVGLRYALPMGYSSTENIRLAFLNVFVNIVSSFNSSQAVNEEKINDAVDQVVMVSLNNPQLLINISRICPASDIDALASSIVYIFEVKNAAHLAVTHLVQDEIKRSTRYMDILRRNSCATRALSMLARLKGSNYLRKILKPVLQELISSGEFFDIEKIDVNEEHSLESISLFKKYMVMVVDAITTSIDDFPPEFFVLCQEIHSSVSERFPDYAKIAVGSFLFLRFFCPALVSPDSEEIVDSLSSKTRKSSMSLAKVIQNIANGSVNSMRWKFLESEHEFLKECNDKIFDFLSEVSDKSHKAKISLHLERKVTRNEFNFIHKFLYYHGLRTRSMLIADVANSDDLTHLHDSAAVVDRLLRLLGQPRMEFKNVMPTYILKNADLYPQLYEFMSKQALKFTDSEEKKLASFVQESVTSEGTPVIVLSWKEAQDQATIDLDAVVYKVIQIYCRILTKSHLCVVDCTGFDESQEKKKFIKLCSLLFNLAPLEGLKNCRIFYTYNSSTLFLDWFLEFCKSHQGVFQGVKIPFQFINSESDPKLIKSLGLSRYSKDVFHDTRVTLHDISLYNEKKSRFTPITMKVGNKFFQIIQGTPRRIKLSEDDEIVSIKATHVYEISNVASTSVSKYTGVSSEFSIEMKTGEKMLFSSPKYLEILKLFYYSQSKILEELPDESYINTRRSGLTAATETSEMISHFLLIAVVGLCGEDQVRSVSYNLLSAMHSTFKLNLGHLLPVSPDIYVPDDPSPIFDPIMKTLADTSPELTCSFLQYCMDLLESCDHGLDRLSTLLRSMGYWVKNLSKHVYLIDEEEGPELSSKIIFRLIKLTAHSKERTSLYIDLVWNNLLHDELLVPVIVDGVISHSMDRAAESVDWRPACKILLHAPTMDMCGNAVDRILRIIYSFLPNLRAETDVNSWTEIIILVHIISSLFCDSSLLIEIYMPEVLFIVSLLIDVGSSDMRSSLHKLLMNACQALLSNTSLPEHNRQNLLEIQKIFSDQKTKFMFGFTQERGRILQNFSASSFLTKFSTLEHFVSNIMSLMENGSALNASQWKTRYVQYITSIVFHVHSFLSARAMMILGIISKDGISDGLLINLLKQSMKIVAMPEVNDEQLFFIISTFFTYTKAVKGVDPLSPLLPKLFWVSLSVALSMNVMLYQSGLLFMSNTAQHLSLSTSAHLERGMIPAPLLDTLMDQRGFADDILKPLESMAGFKVTKENFPHIMISIICKGLLVPYTRPSSLSSLVVFFKLFYFEMMYGPNENYLIFMLFVFVLHRPSNYLKCIEDVDMDGDIVNLDEKTEIHRDLLDWILSDTEDVQLALYQGCVYFSSNATDEQSKTRFLLLYKYYMEKNPEGAFKVYPFVLTELRRLSKYSNNNYTMLLALEIVKNAVRHEEYANLREYEKLMTKRLQKRGLTSLNKLPFENESTNDVMTGIKENPLITYERKKLVVKLLARLISTTN